MALAPGQPLRDRCTSRRRSPSRPHAMAAAAASTATPRPRSTCCAASRRAPAAARDCPRRPATTTSPRSSPRCCDLDDSYLAVQGPPGTGKTYTGAARGRGSGATGTAGGSASSPSRIRWSSTCSTGSSRRSAGRAGREEARFRRRAPRPGRRSSPDGSPASSPQHEQTGCVIGGTAWDFAHTARVPAGSLDLLVIDEAGQFSLANTLARGASARNLLLLGDPQQLPQVSQGTHPEPVDDVGAGLARRRPRRAAARARLLPGPHLADASRAVRGGLGAVLRGPAARAGAAHHRPRPRTASSPACGRCTSTTAATRRSPSRRPSAILGEVRATARHAVDRPGAGERPGRSAERDILVVAPYNAQVALIRARLDRAAASRASWSAPSTSSRAGRPRSCSCR